MFQNVGNGWKIILERNLILLCDYSECDKPKRWTSSEPPATSVRNVLHEADANESLGSPSSLRTFTFVCNGFIIVACKNNRENLYFRNESSNKSNAISTERGVGACWFIARQHSNNKPSASPSTWKNLHEARSKRERASEKIIQAKAGWMLESRFIEQTANTAPTQAHCSCCCCLLLCVSIWVMSLTICRWCVYRQTLWERKISWMLRTSRSGKSDFLRRGENLLTTFHLNVHRRSLMFPCAACYSGIRRKKHHSRGAVNALFSFVTSTVVCT